MDPAVPRAGRLVNLGLYVHRFGGDEPIIDLPVQFTANGQPIGTAYIPGLSPNDEQSTIPLQWIPTQAGGITLVATIDPDHNISEATLSNNTITRTITVISGGTDVQPPHVDALLIFGGTQTTTNPLVSLDTTVIDYPLSPDASGISELRFVEFEYNSAARLWIPIQDTQWLSATNALNDYPFTINEVGGVHYIQAWAKDQVGNVSHYPFQAPINYLAPTDAVGSEQTRIYRQTLSAGQTLQVHLTPKSGDPDLYIWAPDWGSGRPPWVSDQPGLGEELISFTAPVDGIYQIEVFGYSYSDYEITIQQGTQYSDLVKSITPPSSTTKTVPDDPSISPINVPPRPSPIEADFYTDSVIGKVPLTAAFLDTSIGLVTGWDWDFGDGKSSAEQNPMHVYTSTGLYTVKLTVTGPDGADSLERIAYIWVLPQTGSIIYLPEVVR